MEWKIWESATATANIPGAQFETSINLYPHLDFALGAPMWTEVRASHILVDTEKEANDLLKRINAGESFEELAKQHSKCPSGKNGGDLGYFSRGQMAVEFEEAAFELSKGKVSKPVQTDFGFHLIKVVDRR